MVNKWLTRAGHRGRRGSQIRFQTSTLRMRALTMSISMTVSTSMSGSRRVSKSASQMRVMVDGPNRSAPIVDFLST